MAARTSRFYLRVSWRNLWRHRRRTLITSAAMGLGIAMCMASMALQDGMFAKMFDLMVTGSIGHVQLHHPDYPARRRAHDTLPAGMVAPLPEVAGVVAVAPRLYTFALAGGKDTSAGAQVVGVDPLGEAQITLIDGKVETGTWLAEAAGMQAVVGVGLAEDLEVKVGDELVLVGQDAFGGMANDLFTVVGIARTGQTALDRGGMWVHLSDLQAFTAMDDRVHEVLVVGDDVEKADQLRDAVAALPEANDAMVRTWDQVNPQAAQMIAMQDTSAFILLAIVLTVAALGVLNTMLMSVFERVREFGVLRALGLAPRQLMTLVVTESMLLATVAAAMGLAMGGALDAWLVAYGIEFSVDGGKGITYMGITLDPIIRGVVRPKGIVFTVVTVYVVTLVAAVWPAVRAARLEPVQAMRET
jgi:ABC-type lipoprotein release transport system permease subunit